MRADHPGRDGQHVLGECDVDGRDDLGESVIDHGARSVAGLLDGQRVHVGAQQHGGPVAVTHDADDAGAADSLVDDETVLPEAVGDEPRGAVLLV